MFEYTLDFYPEDMTVKNLKLIAKQLRYQNMLTVINNIHDIGRLSDDEYEKTLRELYVEL